LCASHVMSCHVMYKVSGVTRGVRDISVSHLESWGRGGGGDLGGRGGVRRTMGNSPDRIILNAPDTVHILGKLYK